MAKGQDAKKAVKKEPTKTLKEKSAPNGAPFLFTQKNVHTFFKSIGITYMN